MTEPKRNKQGVGFSCKPLVLMLIRLDPGRAALFRAWQGTTGVLPQSVIASGPIFTVNEHGEEDAVWQGALYQRALYTEEDAGEVEAWLRSHNLGDRTGMDWSL